LFARYENSSACFFGIKASSLLDVWRGKIDDSDPV